MGDWQTEGGVPVAELDNKKMPAVAEEKPRTLRERLRALAAKETAAADAATVPMLFGLPMNKERSTHRAQAFNEAAALAAEAEEAPTSTESTVSGPEYREMRERCYAAETGRDAAHERINKWERAFRDVVLERDAARKERDEAVATAERLESEAETSVIFDLGALGSLMREAAAESER